MDLRPGLRRIVAGFALAALTLGTVVPSSGAAARTKPHRLRPIVFVHGFSGSGSQFESPAKRFASNGYPVDYIEAQEYDSTFTTSTVADLYAALDARIARLLQKTGADQVDLAAHSLGTMLSQQYLTSSPERARRVAHYVNLDGWTASEPPGGVPTLAIWGEGSTERTIVGAKNVYFSDQSHTETVTSPQSFAQEFAFLTGRAPRTTAIVPQSAGRAWLSGRVVLFPTNVGLTQATLDVYRVKAVTGQRLWSRPVASYRLTGDGSWGPFRANPAARYEFAVTHANGNVHHFYAEPSRRSSTLIRLLTAIPGTGLDTIQEKSDQQSNLTIIRNREWWGDQGAASDILKVDGVNLLNAATSPRTKRAIAVFAYDVGTDGVSHPESAIPVLSALPFLTGVDLFTAASPRATGRVVVSVKPRGRERPDVVVVPNWPSTKHQISIMIDDAP
ncbi:MAG TPA: alpha/beta fold hydrolase [Kineosporiaceae bacterium]|nr:alpha/beta fold hydrolase [Kineosporiaceae bacterium]